MCPLPLLSHFATACQNFDPNSGTGQAHLGRLVIGFDINGKLYSHLGETLAAGNGIEAGARLAYDSAKIRQVMTSPANGHPAPFLFGVRNETLGATLDQAIERREAVFLERFKYSQQLQNQVQLSYPAILNNLRQMLAKAELRRAALEAAYQAEEVANPPIPPVRRGTTRTYSPNMAMVNTEFDPTDGSQKPVNVDVTTEVKDTSNVVQQRHVVKQPASVPRFLDRNDGKWKLSDQTEFLSQKIESDFTYPRLDNDLAYSQMAVAAHNDLIRQESASYRANTWFES